MVRIIEDMPFEEYAAAPGINGSILKTVDAFSMAHAKATLDGLRKQESDALDFGKCFHSLLLEGREDFVVKPDTYPAPADHEKVKKGVITAGSPLPWNGNAGACKEWLTKHPNKIPLDQQEAASLRGMVAAIREDVELSPFLKGRCELSVFAEKDGMPVKCRIDTLPDGDASPVIDWKSAKCAKPEAFMSSAITLGYHLQAAWTLDVLRLAGITRKEFWFVAVETEFPFVHTVIKFHDSPFSFLRVGRAACRVGFLKIRNAMKCGVWPAYEGGPAENFAPKWTIPMLDQTA